MSFHDSVCVGVLCGPCMLWYGLVGDHWNRKGGMEWKEQEKRKKERKKEGEEGEVQKDDVGCCLSLTDLPVPTCGSAVEHVVMVHLSCC